MQITVNLKQSYGHDRFYPACPSSAIFARIAGCKCLQPHVLELIEKLGYKIKLKEEKKEWKKKKNSEEKSLT